MIYDDFSAPGWPREGWLQHRYPHVDLWDPATIAVCSGAPQRTLTLTLPAYTASHENHIKAMATTERLFDLTAKEGFSVRAEIAVEIYGVQDNPFRLDPGDPRLSAGALVAIDPTTGMVFDFFISNDRITPLYERLPMARSKLGPYPAYSRLLDPAPTRRGAWRAYETRYDRRRDVVEWRVDGEVVARRERAGAPVDSSGPAVKWNSLRVGVGLFTLLDDLCDDCESADDRPRIPGFVPSNHHDLFGQGGRISVRNLVIET
jgi:Family of unknown function (DUF6081)